MCRHSFSSTNSSYAVAVYLISAVNIPHRLFEAPTCLHLVLIARVYCTTKSKLPFTPTPLLKTSLYPHSPLPPANLSSSDPLPRPIDTLPMQSLDFSSLLRAQFALTAGVFAAGSWDSVSSVTVVFSESDGSATNGVVVNHVILGHALDL